ncbi:MAG: DUF58 domain-containing protein [Nocardioidaceae bacterium]
MRSVLSTLTTRGRAFLSAGITCCVAALILGQKDLLRVGLLLVALPIITAIVANRSRYLLASSRELSPGRVQAGRNATVSLRLENPGRAPTGLMLLEDQVPYVLGSRPRFVVEQLRPKWHREIQYTVRSEVRGRYAIGPLTVRLSDPFGFVELSRAFTSRATLIVTPQIHQLPRASLSGDWSGTGDNRPRAFAAAGTEDVTVREYRLGDDLRRIHWGSTARTDELMVRREEQPHQSRATVLLDTRAIAHRGTGPTSSFEYAVAATASIAVHLSDQGFVIRMITGGMTGSETTWHDRGVSGAAEIELLLESLAVVSSGRYKEITADPPDQGRTGLVIAILGGIHPSDVAGMAGLRAGSTRALAILLDVAAWGQHVSSASSVFTPAENQAMLLRRSGWSVAVAAPNDRLADVWREVANGAPGRRGFHVSARDAEEGPAA